MHCTKQKAAERSARRPLEADFFLLFVTAAVQRITTHFVPRIDRGLWRADSYAAASARVPGAPLIREPGC
jgi:hypothetical protein